MHAAARDEVAIQGSEGHRGATQSSALAIGAGAASRSRNQRPRQSGGG